MLFGAFSEETFRNDFIPLGIKKTNLDTPAFTFGLPQINLIFFVIIKYSYFVKAVNFKFRNFSKAYLTKS